MTSMTRPAPPLILVLGAFAVVYVVWGSTYLAIRIAVETLPPYLMAGIRFTLAGVILYACAGPTARRSLSAANWRSAAVSGLIMLLGANGLVCWAEQYVPSGITALIVAVTSLWFVVLDWLFFRGPRPTRPILIGIAVGLAGVAILVRPQSFEGQVPWAGCIALLVACALWALGSLLARDRAMPSSIVMATGLQMLTAGVGFLVVGTLLGEWPRVQPENTSLRSVLALAYLLFIGSLVALTCYGWLLRVASPARVATYAYVNPVIAVLLGAWLGNEPITPNVLIGAAVIVGAVMLITIGKSGVQRPGHSPESADAGESPTPLASTLPGR